MCFKEEDNCPEAMNGCSKCVKMDKIRCVSCSDTYTRNHLLECIKDSDMLSGASCNGCTKCNPEDTT
jgi:hypothetical protein